MSEKTQTLRRVGLIGDVHGKADILEGVLAYLANTSGLDALLCTGDIPGESDADRCCLRLAEAGVLTIRGNHDRWIIENTAVYEQMGLGYGEALSAESRYYLSSLPRTRTFETPCGPLLLCHGLDWDDMAGIYPGGEDDEIAWVLQKKELDRYAIIVAGHTHRRMVRPIEKTVLLNPGTLLPSEEPGFMIADFENGAVQIYDIDPVTRATTLAIERTLP